MAPDQPTALAAGQLSRKDRSRTKRLLELLPGRLHEDEEVLHLAAFSGKGLVAATSQRLFVLRGVEDVDIAEIAYDRMRSFAAGTERRKPFLQIQTDTGEILVNGVREGFQEICALVHARMWDASFEHLTEPPAQVEPLRRAASGS
jgi:hypothetical protein